VAKAECSSRCRTAASSTPVSVRATVRRWDYRRDRRRRLVVSEERGTIGFCFNGNIVGNLDGPGLRRALEACSPHATPTESALEQARRARRRAPIAGWRRPDTDGRRATITASRPPDGDERSVGTCACSRALFLSASSWGNTPSSARRSPGPSTLPTMLREAEPDGSALFTHHATTASVSSVIPSPHGGANRNWRRGRGCPASGRTLRLSPTRNPG